MPTRRERAEAAYKRSENRQALGVLKALDDLLVAQEELLTDVEGELRRQAQRVEQIAKKVQGDLDKGYHINDSGELQQDAVRFDILCAQRQDAVQNLKRTVHYVAKSCGVEKDKVSTILDVNSGS